MVTKFEQIVNIEEENVSNKNCRQFYALTYQMDKFSENILFFEI